MGDLLDFNTKFFMADEAAGGKDTERERVGLEQAWPHLHRPPVQLFLPVTGPPSPTTSSPTRSYPKKGSGERGPREKSTDSPMVTETIVALALTQLPGAWKREQGERAHELPPAVRACPSRCLSICQRRAPGLGAQSPGIDWSSWQEVSLEQSCHHSYRFCLGQGPGPANVHSSIPHTSKVSS